MPCRGVLLLQYGRVLLYGSGCSFMDCLCGYNAMLSCSSQLRWLGLSSAVLYRDAADLLCNDAAKTLSHDRWQADAELHARLEQYRGRAYTGMRILQYDSAVMLPGPIYVHAKMLLCRRYRMHLRLVQALFHLALQLLDQEQYECLGYPAQHMHSCACLGTHVVRQLAPEDDLPLDDEQAGMLLHDRLQNAPPLYDQLARVRGYFLHHPRSADPKEPLPSNTWPNPDAGVCPACQQQSGTAATSRLALRALATSRSSMWHKNLAQMLMRACPACAAMS